MKLRPLALFLVLGASAACFAAADGAWLKKVPQADHDRANPLAGQADAVAAGHNLFMADCARCHGADAQGRSGRPPLRSPRIGAASDGDLAWMLRNGQVFKGMPRWSGLPEQERWQLVAYLRSLNPPASGDRP